MCQVDSVPISLLHILDGLAYNIFVTILDGQFWRVGLAILLVPRIVPLSSVAQKIFVKSTAVGKPGFLRVWFTK